MLFHNQLYIAKPQTKTLYIVNVAGRYPVKFIKDPFLVLFADPDSIVGHTKYYHSLFIACRNGDLSGVLFGMGASYKY